MPAAAANLPTPEKKLEIPAVPDNKTEAASPS
jgi:hypothetical protein